MKTKEELPACPAVAAVSLIGGKWKLLILRNLKCARGGLTNCSGIWRAYPKKC